MAGTGGRGHPQSSKILQINFDLKNFVSCSQMSPSWVCVQPGNPDEQFWRVLEMNSETGRPNTKYICKFCRKKFHTSSNIKSHIRSHTGEKPYRCNFCTKCFSQRTNLKRHLAKHHPQTNEWELDLMVLSQLYHLMPSRISSTLKVRPLTRQTLLDPG